MAAIELVDLGRAYGDRIALTGVTLTLEEGRTLAVAEFRNGLNSPPLQ